MTVIFLNGGSPCLGLPLSLMKKALNNIRHLSLAELETYFEELGEKNSGPDRCMNGFGRNKP